MRDRRDDYAKPMVKAEASSAPRSFRLQASWNLLPEDKGKPRRFRMLAYDGGLLRITGAPAPVIVDLSLLKASAQVKALLQHDSKRPVGHMDRVEITTQIVTEGTLSVSGKDADSVVQAQGNGFEWEASIGVDVEGGYEAVPRGRTVHVNGRDFPGPVLVARRGKLTEISFVGKGAGENTLALVAAAAVPQENAMSEPANTETTDPAELRRAERERIQTIEAACSGEWPAGTEAEVSQLKASAIAEGITIDELNGRLLALTKRRESSELQQLRASRNVNIGGFQPLSAGRSGADVSQSVIECALCLKAGREDVARDYGDDVRNRADGLRKKSLFEMQNLLFAAHGMPTFDNFDGMLRASGASTVSLPNTLGNTMGRMLDVTMRETPATWRSFAAIKSVENFHAHMGIRPFFIGDLEELPDNGEVKHGTMDEGVYTWSVDQYAKMFTIGRKTFINDGVGFFDQVVPQLANAALRKQNDLVWGTILANAGNHFHTDNGNIQTGGTSPLSLASLEVAVKQMRKQRTAEGADLDIVPSVLVVPPDLEVTAKSILNSIELLPDADSTPAPTGNPLKSIVTLQVEPRISNTEKFADALATRWYLFAAPKDSPVIVAFLNGRQSPEIVSFGPADQPDVVAYSWRALMDFGCALGDPQAGQMSAGA
ncbi:MAG: Mu-like prophage major head subunit gpT family protein [Planctomycetaceae bacterium]